MTSEFVETYTVQRWSWNGRLSYIYLGRTGDHTEKQKPGPTEVIINYRDSEGTHNSEQYGDAIPVEARHPVFSSRSFRKSHSDPDPHVQDIIRLNPGRFDEFGAKDGLNRWLLRRIIKAIDDEPGSYRQARWGNLMIEEDRKRYINDEISYSDARHNFLCGTAGCVVGHGFAQLGIVMPYHQITVNQFMGLGSEMFGFTPEQAEIFFEVNWPTEWFIYEDRALPFRRWDEYAGVEGMEAFETPSPDEAITALRRLVNYGMEDRRR